MGSTAAPGQPWTATSAIRGRRLERRSFRAIVDLQTELNRYIANHPKPFTWTKPADQVLAKENRRNRQCTSRPSIS